MTQKESSEGERQCRLCGWREEQLDVRLVLTVKLSTKGKGIVHKGGQVSCTKVKFLLHGEWEDVVHEK